MPAPERYEKVSVSPLRTLVVDAARIGGKMHAIHALIKIDVTDLRSEIRRRRRETGETISLTGYIVAAVGRAVAHDKRVHGCPTFTGKLVLFDEVDVNTIVESEVYGESFPLAHVVRRANERGVGDISEEIATVKADPSKSPNGARVGMARAFVALPWPVRRFLYWWFTRTPVQRKRSMGTVAVSSVGVLGVGEGWGIPIPNQPLNITVGGISTANGPDGSTRDMLHLTITADHDVVDGAPLARFINRFKRIMQTGSAF